MKILVSSLMAIWLTGCGFQLAGRDLVNISAPQTVSVSYATNTSPLKLHIPSAAARARITIATSETEINIGAPQIIERNLSIEALNRPLEREIELRLDVDFVIGQQNLKEAFFGSTVYTNDPLSPASSESAKQAQLEQLYKQLSRQIINQFVALTPQ